MSEALQLVVVIIWVYSRCPTGKDELFFLSCLKFAKLLKYSIKIVGLTHCLPVCILSLTACLLLVQQKK